MAEIADVVGVAFAGCGSVRRKAPHPTRGSQSENETYMSRPAAGANVGWDMIALIRNCRSCHAETFRHS